MIRAILTDIEGTTSSLSFVKDVLFPYAAEKLPAFVRAHADEPSVREQLDAVRAEIGGDADNEVVIGRLLRWIAEDQKITPLKALQGMIWEAGYRQGDFAGHVYPDAAKALRAWHDAGIMLYVYSSGSVAAQKLLFAHTEYGDLTPLFSGYYDTRIGHKREADAYVRIRDELGLAGSAILFLSDIREELDAAAKAGMKTVCLAREALPEEDIGHPVVGDFSQIDLESL